MHGQRIRAAVGDRPRLVEHVAPPFVPAEANFGGHGHRANRLLHRLHQPALPAGLPAERRANPLVREVVDRAAAVEINEIGAARRRERGRPGQFLAVGASQLDAEAGLTVEAPNQRELALTPLLQAPRHRHLADGDPRAELHAQAAVGQVRALRHRSHHQSAVEAGEKCGHQTMIVS